MLIQCFSDSRPVNKDTLYERVEEDTIAVAAKEGFIYLADDKYQITSRGKAYRDE